MTKALIGYSGFVGGTLLKQADFKAQYRSTNIGEIEGRSFETVVCAGAPAQKWLANREPYEDRRKIEGLVEHLKNVLCDKFILISTVDVFKDPVGVDEDTPINEAGLHPYGLHRRILEKFVENHFANYLIVRLPGLVGPGLRKNVIFDFLNNNNLNAIDSRNIFQFYPMVNLWYDIQIALRENLQLLHLTAAPVSVAEIAKGGFGRTFRQELNNPPVAYDMRSKYALMFGSQGVYQYSKRETVLAVRAYAQSEAVSIKTEGETSL
jgi:hypothetical protein